MTLVVMDEDLETLDSDSTLSNEVKKVRVTESIYLEDSLQLKTDDTVIGRLQSINTIF